jgi:hypothetical protein
MQLEPDDIALDRHISTATIRKVLGRPMRRVWKGVENQASWTRMNYGPETAA